MIIYSVNREKENIEVLFSRHLSVRTTRDNDHTYTQTNRHKKKRRIKKMMRRNVTTNKPTKIAGGKTQEQLYTRACAHTYER